MSCPRVAGGHSSRLIDPGSKWRLHRQWFGRSAMGDVLGEDLAVAHSDTLSRCLDKHGRPEVRSMQTAKQEVQELLPNLPDDSSYEDIQYHLYVLEMVRRGEACAETERQRERTRALRGDVRADDAYLGGECSGGSAGWGSECRIRG